MIMVPMEKNAADCPLSSVLDLVGAKWTVQILRELALGPVRTRKFLRLIPGLTMKSLQERIKAMQAYGLITRIEFDEKLPHVEHSITERGRRLLAVMSELKEIACEINCSSCKCSIEGYSQAEMDCPARREA
ncbi:MAG TPA: helix-turn-helix domain-containing protein [Candidatus Obscuribacter sp.]|nr:helix-turn-helix transcriptional regulator [Candidatus Obscuribacter sp.]MBK9277535.1 helix-turn-helix transcriptional regulator [Candidatus Obscuribacter sp.]MBL8085464.1 helix-turn-helix transcriptional regulator [Candidatus Obscuribacter sp.]HMW91265.1 helix-turn-helix domain-containing protein [Candidatus Obscuribacter sp.]HMY05269.1 helix-turn-helix domain-containing protein [Candidatus Obscuribacter sp.]